MNGNKQIKIFYLLSLLGTFLGFFTSMFSLAFFTQVDYGLYTLYLTYISQLGILSFGYQDGMLINYRKKKPEEVIIKFKEDIKFGYLFQFIVLIVSIILIPFCLKTFFNQSGDNYNILILAIISIFPTTIIGNFRNVYSALGEFSILGFVDFYTKVYLLLGVLAIKLFSLNVFQFIYLDLIFKLIILLYLLYDLNKKIKKYQNHQQLECDFTIKDHFKKGLFVLIGNWAYVFIFTLDKNFLSVDGEKLGLYAYSFFILTVAFQLLIPVKNVIVSTINEHMTKEEINTLIHRVCSILYLLLFLYIFIGTPIIKFVLDFAINNFNLGQGFSQKLLGFYNAIDLSKYITLILPLYICIQLILTNLIMLKNQKLYSIMACINFVMTFLIYYIIVNFTNMDVLDAVVIATLVNYLASFLLNVFVLTSFIDICKYFCEFIGIFIIFLLVKDFFFLQIIVIILSAVYMIKLQKKVNDKGEVC